jgi:hypothetical protein
MNAIPSPSVDFDKAYKEFRDMAKRFKKHVGGDRQQAVDLFFEAVKKRPEIYAMIADRLVRMACNDVLSSKLRSERAHAWNAASDASASQQINQSTANMRAGVSALARATVGLMDGFRMPNGKTLGASVYAEIVDAIPVFAKSAESMAHKARFLEEVAKAMRNNDKPVSKQLTEKKLVEIQKQTAGLKEIAHAE